MLGPHNALRINCVTVELYDQSCPEPMIGIEATGLARTSMNDAPDDSWAVSCASTGACAGRPDAM